MKSWVITGKLRKFHPNRDFKTPVEKKFPHKQKSYHPIIPIIKFISMPLVLDAWRCSNHMITGAVKSSVSSMLNVRLIWLEKMARHFGFFFPRPHALCEGGSASWVRRRTRASRFCETHWHPEISLSLGFYNTFRLKSCMVIKGWQLVYRNTLNQNKIMFDYSARSVIYYRMLIE